MWIKNKEVMIYSIIGFQTSFILSSKIRTRTLSFEIRLISVTQNRIWVSRSFVKVSLYSTLFLHFRLFSHPSTFRHCGNVQCERTLTGHRSSTIAGIGPAWQERR